VSIVCFQVEVSASGLSLVYRIPTEFGVSECDRAAPIVRRPWPTRSSCTRKKKRNLFKQEAIISVMCTDLLVCVMQKQCVFCEVGSEFYAEYNFDNSRITGPTLSRIAESLRLN
jgi:hypothetical protein